MESLYIRDEHGRTVPMRFSQSQEILWSHVAPRLNRRDKLWFVTLKARQIYSSTFWCALTFVRTLEQPGTHSLVLAHDLFTSHDIFDKCRTFYDHLPLPKLRSPRVNELIFPFPNGTSRYRVISAGTVAKGRGTTQTCLLTSELPSWPHPEIAIGLFQAMPDLPDTVLVEESTAKGISGPGKFFWEEWDRATRGESDLEPIFVPWHVMTKYRRAPALAQDDWDREERLLHEAHGIDGEQLAWRRYVTKTKLQNSIEMFRQEYPSTPAEAFIASGQPAFDRLALMDQQKHIRAPKWRGDFVDGQLLANDRGTVRIWSHPTTAGEYVIGADTAMGLDGGNYTAAEVIDMKTMEQVASVHGIIQPYEFSVLLNSLGRYYNKAVLCIEVYPQGHTVQDHLIRTFFYPNLHRWRGKPDRVRLTPARLYGWETNVWSRPMLVGSGQRAINHGLLTIHEDGLLDELMHFSKSDTEKFEAEVGYDDRVLALLLALRSREENYVERRTPIELSEPDLPRSIRIVDAESLVHTYNGETGQITTQAQTRRRLSKILQTKAKEAVERWTGPGSGDRAWMRF